VAERFPGFFLRAAEPPADMCRKLIAVIESPHFETNPNLFQVGDTLDRCRSLLGTVHRRQSQRDKEKNDHENCKELDQRKRDIEFLFLIAFN